MPTFSLILPVYNTAEFLEKCIDSILGQSYADFEVILVNDGSTDNSLEICRKYQDDRILVLDKKNGGVSSARNFGINHATGDYIWFIDSDDWIPGNALEIVHSHITADAVDILLFNYYETALESQIISPNENPVEDTGVFSGVAYVNKYLLLEPTVWTKAFKRSFLQKIGLQFEDEIMVGEDFHFNLHAFKHAQKIRGIATSLYYYRRRPNSIMTSRPSDKHIDSQLSVMVLLDDLLADGVYEEAYLEARLTHEMYFLLRLLWYSKSSVDKFKSYLARIEALGITIPACSTDSWIDRMIKTAFNHNLYRAYRIHLAHYFMIRIGHKTKSFRTRLSRMFFPPFRVSG